MDWSDPQKPPRGYVTGPVPFRITEWGPVRVALEVERETQGSRFDQTLRLPEGEAGERIEVQIVMDWRTGETAFKTTFPSTASNPTATSNWDVGTNDENRYQVLSHQWFDLTGPIV